MNDSELEKNKIDTKLFLKNGPTIKFPKPKKIPRNNGKLIIDTGIKNLKFSSNVNECEIQYVPAKKKPPSNFSI